MIVLEDDLDDPNGDKPYEESPGVWICRRCAAEIRSSQTLCRHCKRARTFARRRDRSYRNFSVDTEKDDE